MEFSVLSSLQVSLIEDKNLKCKYYITAQKVAYNKYMNY